MNDDIPSRRNIESWDRRPLGEALGLENFGVNLLRVPPGCASSQRHWHSGQDEFVHVAAGEVVLVTEGGEQRPTAGKADCHRLVNRSAHDALLLEVGDRAAGGEATTPTST